MPVYSFRAELKEHRYNSYLGQQPFNGGQGYGEFVFKITPTSYEDIFDLYFSGDPIVGSRELIK